MREVAGKLVYDSLPEVVIMAASYDMPAAEELAALWAEAPAST